MRAAFALVLLAGLAACSSTGTAPVCFVAAGGELHLGPEACALPGPEPKRKPPKVRRVNPRASDIQA
jgi:hypothetical protein